jgi:Ala-tRNA(Pro) deacylase
MTISRKVKGFLDKNHVAYKVFPHHEAFTAQEIAAYLHVPGQELAKVVVVKTGDSCVLTVMPASYKLNMSKMKKILGDNHAILATEEDFKDLFPDCEVGAMPPFGNLYDVDVYVDRSLTTDKEIFFQAGNHVETIKMTYKDFERLSKPKVAEFATHL